MVMILITINNYFIYKINTFMPNFGKQFSGAQVVQPGLWSHFQSKAHFSAKDSESKNQAISDSS